MNILGIDLGTRHFAMCFMSENGIYHLEELDMSKIKSHKVRRRTVWNLLTELDQDEHIVKPDMVVLEKIILFHKSHINVNTIKRLGGLSHLVIDHYFDAESYEVPVQSWKASVLGSARSTKEDAIKYVKEKYNVDTNNDNLADAICIAECGHKYFHKLQAAE